MKSDLMPSIVHPSIISNLIEVKETVATGLKIGKNRRAFGTTDLWNIRRNARTASALLRK